MLLSTAEDLAKFVEELQRETDRGLPLVAAALIDDRLMETLRAFFRDTRSAEKLLAGGSAPLATFSARSDACHALGLIDDHEHGEIALIRKIRNEFAHAKHGISFRTQRITDLCANLKTEVPPELTYLRENPRSNFTNSAVSIVLRLYHRPEWVALERRAAKSWVDQEAVRWRSIEDDPPPKGVPVMLLGRGSRPTRG